MGEGDKDELLREILKKQKKAKKKKKGPKHRKLEEKKSNKRSSTMDIAKLDFDAVESAIQKAMGDSGSTNAGVKVVLLGSSGVGKSSILRRLVEDKFQDDERATIGAEFKSHTVDINDRKYVLNIWDTAGQERYGCLQEMYYRGASAAIIVYEASSEESFARAKKWVNDLKELDASTLIVLVSNKTDLFCERSSEAKSEIIVSEEVAETYSHENGILFMKCSAKSGKNIRQLFQVVARILVARRHGAKNQARKGLIKLENSGNSCNTCKISSCNC